MIYKREFKNHLDNLLIFFYDVLLAVENDEVDYRKNCDWTYVKNNAKNVSIENLMEGYISIRSNNGELSLNLIKRGSIASEFLMGLRDAFAHNFIKYDSKEKIIEIELNKRGSGRMNGKISQKGLVELVKLIKESHSPKKENGHNKK